MSSEVFKTVLRCLNQKADKPTGNHYLFLCNEKLYDDIQNTLGEFLVNYKTDGAWLYSKTKNDYVKVGNTFDSYEYAGNSIQFKVDRTFSLEFGDEKGYGLCLDLTADLTSGHAPIEMFSLRGKDLVTNKFVGVTKSTCAA